MENDINYEEEINIAKDILYSFIEKLGYDGKLFSAIDTPYVLTETGLCKYYTPGTSEIDKLAKQNKIDKKYFSKIDIYGITKYSKKMLDEVDFSNRLVYIIHEKIHAIRNIFIFDVDKDNGYILEDGVLKQTSNKYKSYHADPAQDILHGSTDTSKNTIKKYSSIDHNTFSQMKFNSDEESNKTSYDQEVDETLVDLMSYCACYLYFHPDKSIFDSIKYFASKDDKKIANMCKIMLNHGDLELFRWKLCPIEYSHGDIHFDFFESYTKNDPDELKKEFCITYDLEDGNIFKFL